MAESKEDRVLIFMHIPRTGGGTLVQVLRRQYAPHQVYSGDLTFPSELAAFDQVPRTERDEFRLIVGHLVVGVHKQLSHEATYITLLREPIQRVISQYFFALERDQLQPPLDEAMRDLSLRDFVESGIRFRHTNNSMTRFFAGVGPLERTEATSELLDRARLNLRSHFSVVGVTELFDETVVMGTRVFGWRRPYYVRQHVADRIGRPSVDDSTLALIREHNQFDIELYEEVRKSFIESMERAGPSFRRHLRRFRILNRGFQKTYPVMAPVLRRAKKLGRSAARTNL